MSLTRPLCWLGFCVFVCLSLPTWALGDDSWVRSTFKGGNFPLVGEKSQADILVSSKEFSGVIHAAKDLQHDVKAVSGREPVIFSDTTGNKNYAVILGTLGQSPMIDQLIASGELDVEEIRGQWDAYKIQVINKPKPFPQLKKILVIAGSNKRGTSYGIYSLSEQIGVSPWYWWADVPIKPQQRLYIMRALNLVDMPQVKYRGISLASESPALSNQSPALARWATAKYGGFNHEFYQRLFELLLRLKANFLWPATGQNSFADADKLNLQLADDYGIVMGSSPAEPLLRARSEWRREGTGPWDYTTNDKTLDDFWLKGIERSRAFESSYTLGMRESSGMPLSDGGLIEKILHRQRELLTQANPDKALADIPQILPLTSENLERDLHLPEDVTLLWSDDNWGNLRRLPTVAERRRAGGAGIYYHLSYTGSPRTYGWLNSVTIAKMQEQMNLAYTYDANRVWMLDVGDLKPMEFPMEFFLRMAWNPEAWPKERIPAYGRTWAAREFDPRHADEIAELMYAYNHHNSLRKPELQSAETFSLLSYREAERQDQAMEQLSERANRLYRLLPEEQKDAFFQLVLYPVKASANITQMYIAQARNQLYATQGRADAKLWGDEVRRRFAADARLRKTWDTKLNLGKWQHFMDQPHIGYTHWDRPAANTQPLVYDYLPHGEAEMGVAAEGTAEAWPSATNLQLARFDVYGQPQRALDVFNRGTKPFNLEAQTSAPWIVLDNTRIKIETSQRLEVSVDWAQMPKGEVEGWIDLSASCGGSVRIKVSAYNPGDSKQPEGFIQADGYVAIDAQHFARSGSSGAFQWVPIPQHGRHGSSISVFPLSDFSFEEVAKAPFVEYDFYLWSAGEFKVHSEFAPSLPFMPGHGLRFAIAVDDEKPQRLDLAENSSQSSRELATSNNLQIISSTHHVDRAGKHRLRVYMIDPGVVLERLIIDTGGLKNSYLGPEESRKL